MYYVNDGRYGLGDGVAEGTKKRKKFGNDVEFYQTGSPLSATSFRSYRLLSVTALRILKYSEKLFLDYGNTY